MSDNSVPDTLLYTLLAAAREELGDAQFNHADAGQTLRARDNVPTQPSDLPTVLAPQSAPESPAKSPQSTVPDDGDATILGEHAPHLIKKLDGFAREDEYTIRQRVGKGGMGEIFLAGQNALRRDVAIKKIIPERLEHDVARKFEDSFVAEALITGYLDHPNIVPVHALGRGADGSLFFSMKMVRGIEWRHLLHPNACKDATLKERALARHLGVDDPARRGASLDENLRILLSVCNAVAYAHSKHVIHRDLKPENVMVGAFGEVLVMDWGLAVDVSENPPSANSPERRVPTRAESGFGGTPSYMAPEQFAVDARGHSTGDQLGLWTDVFLLGAMLSEIVTGQPPYGGTSLKEVLGKVCACEPSPLLEKAPAELAAICRRAMAKKPADRFPDAQTFQQAIQNFMTHRQAAAIAAKAEHEARVPEIPHLSRAVVLYDQALELWPENSAMATAAENARATLSIKERHARWTRRSLYAAAASIVLGLTVGFIWIQSARNDAMNQMTIAKTKSAELADALKISDERAKLLMFTLDKEIFEIQDKLNKHPGLQDIKKELLSDAVQSYSKALADLPQSAHAERQTLVARQKLGDAYADMNDTAAARIEYEKALAIAEKLAANSEDPIALRDLSSSWDRIGAISEKQDRLDDAMKAYQTSLALTEKRARDAANLVTQYDLVAAHRQIGNLRLSNSDAAGALTEFEKAQTLADSLARVDAASPSEQRERAVSLDEIGIANQRLGRAKDAVAAFEKSLAIRKQIAESAPENAAAQRDLAFAYFRSGSLALESNDNRNALDLYQKSQLIVTKLAADNPLSTAAQRDLSIAYDGIGKAYELLKDTAHALEAYHKSLDITKRFADADPSSAAARRDLSIAYEQIGNANSAVGGDLKAARSAYQQALDIDLRLAAKNPGNIQAQRGLSISYQRMSEICLRSGDGDAAMDFALKSLDLAEKLAASNPGNPQLKRDLAISHDRLGTLNLTRKQVETASAEYQKATDIRVQFAEADRANDPLQQETIITMLRIATTFQTAKELKTAIAWYTRCLDFLQKLSNEKKLTAMQNGYQKWCTDHIAECNRALQSDPSNH